jgi:hypothetical protein
MGNLLCDRLFFFFIKCKAFCIFRSLFFSLLLLLLLLLANLSIVVDYVTEILPGYNSIHIPVHVPPRSRANVRFLAKQCK